MKTSRILVALIAAAALTACTNADRFGPGSGAGANGGLAGGAGLAGSVNDPTSPAYFNQTIGDQFFKVLCGAGLHPRRNFFGKEFDQ